jgi:hypothetical protein
MLFLPTRASNGTQADGLCAKRTFCLLPCVLQRSTTPLGAQTGESVFQEAT